MTQGPKGPVKPKAGPHALSSERILETHPALFEERREEYIRNAGLPFQRRSYLIQLTVFALVLAVWSIPVINPIKLLVVLFHEMSHVLAGYATGASIFGIAIDPGGAGVTLGMGGNRLLILVAGYIGSFAMGFCLYGLCATWKPGEVWLVLAAFSGISLTMGWLNDFTAVFGYGTLIAMVAGGLILPPELKVAILRIVGTASCLYPLIDVAGEAVSSGAKGFEIRGSAVGSDVMVFSRLTGTSWWLLAGFWVVSGFLLLAFLVTWSARKEAATEVRGQLFRRASAKRQTRYRKYDPNDASTIPEYTID